MAVHLRIPVTIVALFGTIFVYPNVIFAAVTLCDSSSSCPAGLCGLGEYFSDDTRECLSCSGNTYMDLFQHACSCCKPCTAANIPDRQIYVRACSVVSDAVIGCAPGYLKEHSSGICKPFPECDVGRLHRSLCDNGIGNRTCAPGPGLTTGQKEGRPMRTSVVIVGSVAGSLLAGLIVAGFIKYIHWKTKQKNFKYSSAVNI